MQRLCSYVFKKSHKKNRFISEPVLPCGERGTTTLQTPKNQKNLFIYKKSIKSILYKGLQNKRYWIILDKLGYFWTNVG